jgi:urease accessory protein
VTLAIAPFSPEGGAYGHGRTMGHDHGPQFHSHG